MTVNPFDVVGSPDLAVPRDPRLIRVLPGYVSTAMMAGVTLLVIASVNSAAAFSFAFLVIPISLKLSIWWAFGVTWKSTPWFFLVPLGIVFSGAFGLMCGGLFYSLLSWMGSEHAGMYLSLFAGFACVAAGFDISSICHLWQERSIRQFIAIITIGGLAGLMPLLAQTALDVCIRRGMTVIARLSDDHVAIFTFLFWLVLMFAMNGVLTWKTALRHGRYGFSGGKAK